MPRTARVVLPGQPHHITQRANRRQRIFFSPADYRYFKHLLAEAAAEAGAAIWAYCFMPNHFHLVAVPSTESGLRRLLANPQRRYAIEVNARFGWSGHLWQGRFHSTAMDEAHLAMAIRYVSLNPVRAGLVQSPDQWPWSSVRAHLNGVGDGLADIEPILSRFPGFAGFLAETVPDSTFTALRKSELTGRSLSSVRVTGDT
jgi:putative transposase